MPTANVVTLARSDGKNHIADEGEVSRIKGQVYDEDDPENPIQASAITAFTLTLQDEDTREILNGRDESDILSILNPDGSFELLLTGDDNTIVDPTKSVEYHIATVDWTYLNKDGVPADGAQKWRVQVATDLGAATPDPPGPVGPYGNLVGPLYIGDSYLSANKQAFIWSLPAPDGFTDTAEVIFYGNRCACNDQYTDGWEIRSGVIAAAAGVWTITVEMTAEETAAIVADLYRWSLRIEESGAVKTLFDGTVEWRCI